MGREAKGELRSSRIPSIRVFCQLFTLKPLQHVAVLLFVLLDLIIIALIALLIRLQNAQFVFGYMLPYEYDPFYHLRLAEVIVHSGYRPDFDYYLNYPYELRIDWLPLFVGLPNSISKNSPRLQAMLAFSFILPVILGVISRVLSTTLPENSLEMKPRCCQL
jgi:asparagine N-glycosylation enzyme membrane subunit Stt3